MPQPVAFVTGASTGIGFATAKKLAGSGFTVYAGARRVEKMEPLKAHGVAVLALDVTDEESMSAAVGEVLAAHGRIDVLVNNAGYGSYGSLEEVEPAEGRRQFDVNVFGLARMTQLVIPAMRAAGRGGSSTSPPWAARCMSRSGPGTTPRSSPSRASAIPSDGTQAPRHRRVHHRAGRHPVRVGRHFRPGPAGHVPGTGRMRRRPESWRRRWPPPTSRALHASGAVADAIVHAATAARPRTRYPVGGVRGPFCCCAACCRTACSTS